MARLNRSFQQSKGEPSGIRIVGWGMIRELEDNQVLAPGFSWLTAERLRPERLASVAVTRHLRNHGRR